MSNNGLRQSGIEPVGAVEWGTHFCQFYQTQMDLLETLVPYFQTGLRHNEFCMWVTAHPLDSVAAHFALQRVMPDIVSYEEKGQIEILPHADWYLKGGVFDQERVLQGWVNKLAQAQARGFDGLRLSGNTFWLEHKDWASFTAYEAAINRVIGRYPMIALCTYSLERCTAEDIEDVIRNHEFALIKQNGQWAMAKDAASVQALV